MSTALFEFLASVTLTTILAASTFSTTPLFFATTQTPESPATIVSKPVPTRGFITESARGYSKPPYL